MSTKRTEPELPIARGCVTGRDLTGRCDECRGQAAPLHMGKIRGFYCSACCPTCNPNRKIDHKRHRAVVNWPEGFVSAGEALRRLADARRRSE